MGSPEAKLRFMCSFGGRFSPDPNHPLRYIGGDTRVVSLPRRSPSLCDLRSKLSRVFSLTSAFSLKYLLPSSASPSLLPLSDDNHLRDLLLHHDRLPRPSRIRLFLLPLQKEEEDVLYTESLSLLDAKSSSSSFGSLGSSSAEEDLELVGKASKPDGVNAPETDSCLERILFFQERNSPVGFDSKHEDGTMPSNSPGDTVQSQVAELAEEFVRQQLRARQSPLLAQHQTSNPVMPLQSFYPVHTQPALPQSYHYSPQMPAFFMPAQPNRAYTTQVPGHNLVDVRGIAVPSNTTSVPLSSMMISDQGIGSPSQNLEYMTSYKMSTPALPVVQPPPIPRFLSRTDQNHPKYVGYIPTHQNATQDASTAGYRRGSAVHPQLMFYEQTTCTQLLPQYQAMNSVAAMMLSNVPQ